MSHLQLSNNKQEIIDEVNAGKFSINMEDHVLHLKSFVDKDLCDEVVKAVNNIQDVDKSSQYTDGLLNDDANSYFDADIPALATINDYVFNNAMEIYAEKSRAFNWAYYKHKRFRYSEMILRKYYPGAELSYHHDDVIIEVFPHWFPKRQNILTANIYFNDTSEYGGGDLYYPAFDKTYTPSTGDVIIFPSNWMFYHKVTEITSGNRYAGTVWYYYGSNKPIKKGASHVERFSK